MRELVAVFLVAVVAVVLFAAPGEGGRGEAAGGAVVEGRVVMAGPGEGTAPSRPVRYGRDVRPILSDRCFLCHGTDPETREAGLRLDEPEEAMRERDGVRAIVPGDPGASELWRRITAHDPDEVMPPASAHKRPISEEERGVIRAWIEGGAEYEPHWAFVPVQRPEVPGGGSDGSSNEIDRFIDAELARAGLTPGPAADRATQLRRVFLDLTGLPPTPEELSEFLAETDPGAYERWVDRLLTHEPYLSRHAEHRAAAWLDQARYADTCGIHTDNGRSLWPWRDWVLRAIRDNMPFDQFVVDQLAGDLRPDATVDQRVASGFNRNHVTTDEGGAIAEEYLVEYAVDRVSTTGAVFMGLTLGCARCHDHKFDPITAADFYGLMAFFNSIDEPGLYSQTQDSKRAYEPFLAVPSADQSTRGAELAAAMEAIRAEMRVSTPEEDAARAEFTRRLTRESGLAWESPRPASAESGRGAALTVQDDGSVLAAGENPDRDDHTITLRTNGTGLRLIALEAMADPTLPMGRVGRASNGNAVLGEIEVEAVSLADPERTEPVRLVWAWADVEQQDGDYQVVNAIDGDPERGWAVDAHNRGGGRVAMFLADEAFGFEGGTELRIRLRYESVYAQHVFGRVRLSVGRIGEELLASLPEAAGRWQHIGPFPVLGLEGVYEEAAGPELSATLELGAEYRGKRWRFEGRIRDGEVVAFSEGLSSEYVARQVYSPTAREVELSLGSDDGLRVYVNGEEAFGRQTQRGVAPDQDRAKVSLRAGVNTLVFKIVNTGGASGFYHRVLPREAVWPHDLAAAVLPSRALEGPLAARADEAWRRQASPRYLELDARRAGVEREIAALEASIPRTMVMKELETPRETFVLTRGEYDKPDRSRPVERAIPAVFGALPAGAPRDRMGLAQWLVSEENPLLARVTVNRVWESFFGAGLVRTSDDFGYQGEYPSHPELLDYLAVEFRESGWDTRALLRRIVTSETYRRSSRVRESASVVDPENRLLSWFPRRRLTAEQIRDQALFVSGLLVERLGGESVRPYQPPGLWREVAMPASNTRVFERGEGPDLWRRSLYTYWKRAAPPPSMLTFDAPTREFCTIRRMTTNTPLQALVLWNDVQFVESARALAARTLAEAGDDRARLRSLLRRAAAREATEEQLADLGAVLEEFRARYRAAPADAERLVSVGESAAPEGADAAELASWTMIASAVLSSDLVIVKD